MHIKEGFALALIFMFLLPPASSWCNPRVEDPAAEVFREIYNLRFDQAHMLLRNKAIDPDLREILFADLYWWEAIASNSEDKFDVFLNQLAQRSKASPFWNTTSGKVVYHTYCVRTSLSKQNFVSALSHYYTLRQSVNDLSNDPESSSDQLSAYLQYYREALSFMELVYFRKHLDRGAQASSQAILARIEAQSSSDDLITASLSHYFLWKYYSESGKNSSGRIQHCKALHSLFPDNQFFRMGSAYPVEQLTIN